LSDERNRAALLALLKADGLPVPQSWNSQMRQSAAALILRDLQLRTADRSNGPFTAFEGRYLPSVTREVSSAESAAADFAGKLPQLRPIHGLVICPLAKELNPASLVFGFDPFAEEHDNLDGHKIFYVELPRTGRSSITIGVSVLTRARNVNAALATFKLLLAFRFSPEVVVLSGIGGGVRSKLTLGDVVVAFKVIDVASKRAQPPAAAMRDDEYPVNARLLRQLSHLPARVMRRDRWPKEVRDTLPKIRDEGYQVPLEEEIQRAKFKVSDGIVVAGEDLVADGSLPTHLVTRDDRIRSCDMEGSGFAQAAEESGVPWAVFRGISDYGEPDKSDEWQAIAAYSAALAARRFLETEFRLKQEMQSLTF